MKCVKFCILYFLVFILHEFTCAQNPQLAQKYLEEGAFDKAQNEYRLLLDKFPYKDDYLFNLIKAYQAQSKFEQVEKLLKSRHPKQKPQYWVYLGYNYQIQKDTAKAQKYYNKAVKAVQKRSYYAYAVGDAFKKLYLLDYALQTYETAMQSGKNNFYMQMALIYAEKNEPDKMVHYFLNLAETSATYQARIKYYLSQYITSDPENQVNVILKNQLIEKIKTTHATPWYRLLQWLYVQQKEYKKAFLQLKSLYRKGETDPSEIYQLANTTNFEGKPKAARRMYNFIIEQKNAGQYAELSKLALIKMDLKHVLSGEQINELQQQFDRYLHENWSDNNLVKLQILYADFLAFHQKQIQQALDLLSKLDKQPLNKKLKAEVQLKKADILLYDKQFNRALILYTQVQLDFPNHPTGHKASFDIARASFFQGDVDWAHGQLKVIKSVTDDLIANDAIALDLIIVNNKEENDSLQTGLKMFARAKFEIFRKNIPVALQILDSLKQNYKGQLIYDDALWTQAQLYERLHKTEAALRNYQAIIDNQTEDLYVDDALYRMALIYETLGNDEQAKKLFKKIVIEYPASFWYVDARKHFRKLRGDHLN